MSAGLGVPFERGKIILIKRWMVIARKIVGKGPNQVASAEGLKYHVGFRDGITVLVPSSYGVVFGHFSSVNLNFLFLSIVANIY